MDTKIILDEVVNQLTDNFSKAKSVNYMYKKCKKIVEMKIDEDGQYDFESLLNWLNEVKSKCYKGKYKYIKRILYGLNDFIKNGTICSNARFIYQNDNSQFKKVSNNSQKIITEYMDKKYGCRTNYLPYLRNYLSYYFLFIEKQHLNFRAINYADLFKFRLFIKSLNFSERSETNICNISAKFIFETGKDLKTKIGSLIINTRHRDYIEKIIEMPEDFLNSFDINDAKINLGNIPLFFEELRKKKYSTKCIVHSKKIAKELLFFSFHYNIPLTLGNTLLWSKFIYENVFQDPSYRSFGIKFVEFLKNGAMSHLNSYFDSLKFDPHEKRRQINDAPSWSKPMIDKYIAYRKGLGYKPSTICMDGNSIYRFIIYISNLGIDDYSLIKPEHVISFASFDAHSTTEGKNAYITRVRGFLTFLHDKKIIDFYIDQRILGNFRIKKKIINIFEEKDILKIVSKKYETPTDIRAYAIFLLGLKCGLRSVDIVNLKFENISFVDKTLKIMQTKTQKEIVLPTPTIVLNAIYDYVKNARPKTLSKYVFISSHIPFENLKREVCIHSLNLLLKINGIDQNKYKGFHICRKTYASSIINRTKDVDITAYSLGHSDNSTVDDYVSIDTSSMHECPLSLKTIGYGGYLNESL